MNKYISILIVLVVIGLGAFLIMRGDKEIKNVEVIPEPVVPTVEENKTTEINNNEKDINKMTSATLSTNMGDITIEFFDTDAPKTVENFKKLASTGFYNEVKFHRVIKGFMIQAGDPNSKDDAKMAMWGTGGPGYKFADEINAQSDLYTKMGYKKGVVAMANSGPNTNGSQFFIMHADYPLPPLYTIFGKVTAGQDVVDKIASVTTGASDRPVEPVVINSIVLK